MIKGLVASYHANVGVVHSSFLMISMAFCWAVSHVHITSLRSNSLSGLVKEIKLGANLPIWFTLSRNRCNSVTLRELGYRSDLRRICMDSSLINDEAQELGACHRELALVIQCHAASLDAFHHFIDSLIVFLPGSAMD